MKYIQFIIAAILLQGCAGTVLDFTQKADYTSQDTAMRYDNMQRKVVRKQRYDLYIDPAIYSSLNSY